MKKVLANLSRAPWRNRPQRVECASRRCRAGRRDMWVFGPAWMQHTWLTLSQLTTWTFWMATTDKCWGKKVQSPQIDDGDPRVWGECESRFSAGQTALQHVRGEEETFKNVQPSCKDGESTHTRRTRVCEIPSHKKTPLWLVLLSWKEHTPALERFRGERGDTRAGDDRGLGLHNHVHRGNRSPEIPPDPILSGERSHTCRTPQGRVPSQEVLQSSRTLFELRDAQLS